MGILIIDGNSVFEIDEECVKKRKMPKSCDIDKYLKQKKCKREEEKNSQKKKNGDG